MYLLQLYLVTIEIDSLYFKKFTWSTSVKPCFLHSDLRFPSALKSSAYLKLNSLLNSLLVWSQQFLHDLHLENKTCKLNGSKQHSCNIKLYYIEDNWHSFNCFNPPPTHSHSFIWKYPPPPQHFNPQRFLQRKLGKFVKISWELILSDHIGLISLILSTSSRNHCSWRDKLNLE